MAVFGKRPSAWPALSLLHFPRLLRLSTVEPNPSDTYIHTYIRTYIHRPPWTPSKSRLTRGLWSVRGAFRLKHGGVSFRAQELCKSRGGRPGLPALIVLVVSVDVKQHWTEPGELHTQKQSWWWSLIRVAFNQGHRWMILSLTFGWRLRPPPLRILRPRFRRWGRNSSPRLPSTLPTDIHSQCLWSDKTELYRTAASASVTGDCCLEPKSHIRVKHSSWNLKSSIQTSCHTSSWVEEGPRKQHLDKVRKACPGF